MGLSTLEGIMSDIKELIEQYTKDNVASFEKESNTLVLVLNKAGANSIQRAVMAFHLLHEEGRGGEIGLSDGVAAAVTIILDDLADKVNAAYDSGGAGAVEAKNRLGDDAGRIHLYTKD
jgi:hypothetical protein